jgi:diacylglycerol O-acyltransferase
MPNYAYERLRAEDASFLLFEGPHTPMHVAWTWIFDGGPLLRADGGVDIARVRRLVAARLYRFPRFRQRLEYVPVDGHPVWVDDERFKLHYHVRHVCLPEPGGVPRLQTASAAIIAQPLDRSKPLWELWVVEGLGDGCFAVVSKTHHCMVDGVSTVDLMTGLLDDGPSAHDPEAVDWIPRPAPSSAALLGNALGDRVRAGARAAGRLARAWSAGAPALRGAVRDVADLIERAPETAINQVVGPHRMVHWIRIDLAGMRAVAQRLDATVNDLVLAMVAGGLRRFLLRRPGSVTAAPLRVALPAHTAHRAEPGVLGNRATAWIVSLPTNVADAAERLARVRKATATLGGRPGHGGIETLFAVAEALGGRALGLAVRLRHWLHSYNLIVTSIPGPRTPRWLGGARLVEAYPHIPLFRNQALGIAVASYDGALHVGLNADWEVIPTLPELADDLGASLAELRALAPPPTLSVVRPA